MTHEDTGLTDRYIAAAGRGVHDQERERLERELREDIAARVAGLTGGGTGPDEAERHVLTELGDPALIAARHGGPPQHLIGPAYFGEYRRLLTLLVSIVVPAVGAIMLVLQGVAGTDPVDVALSTLALMFQVAVQLMFWVTLVYAILDRYEPRRRPADWTPDDLPEPADRHIGLGDTVASVTALSVLVWAILYQRDHWLITSADGTEVPALNQELWSSWMPVLLAVLGLSIVLEIVKYRMGRWTVTLALANTALNAVFAVMVVWLWYSERLVNPAVTEVLPEGVPALLDALPWIVVVISTVDTLQGWWALRPGPAGGTPPR